MVEGRMEGKRKTQTEAHGLDHGGRIRETQRKGTTSGGVESMEIWTCQKADNLKKRRSRERQPITTASLSMNLPQLRNRLMYVHVHVSCYSLSVTSLDRIGSGSGVIFLKVALYNYQIRLTIEPVPRLDKGGGQH